MNELSLFTGIGGGLLGSKLLGWNTRCAVEIDPYCRKILLARQRDGVLDRFPIWDDIKTFDGRPWRGSIDIVTGGFPCQDISAAGKRKGITGPRSGLVFEMLRIVEEVRPKFVFAENSPHLRTRGLGTILTELTGLGYVGCHGVLGAWHVGANHKRNRMWVLAANPSHLRSKERGLSSGETEKNPHVTVSPENARRGGKSGGCPTDPKGEQMGVGGQSWGHKCMGSISDWWRVSRFAGMDDGNANRVDRVKATGNAQVPGVAAVAFQILYDSLGKINK